MLKLGLFIFGLFLVLPAMACAAGEYEKVLEMFGIDIETTGYLAVFVLVIVAALKEKFKKVDGKITDGIALLSSLGLSVFCYYNAMASLYNIPAILVSTIVVWLAPSGTYFLTKRLLNGERAKGSKGYFDEETSVKIEEEEK